jgi:D-alanyl-D-alanine carboxypeptidase/D-alanyl-D-alanine-endopeptidase (penicillin-binding protein 4)
MKSIVSLSFSFIILLLSCSPTRQLSKAAYQQVLDNKEMQTAHIGITVYDPEAGRYIYNYQGDKFFVPASNIKIPTCYIAMKYLGGRLKGLEYAEKDSQLYIRPTGDPTFLHRDYQKHPAFEFLQASTKKLAYIMPNWQSQVYGSGWSWNDYSESYMPERSEMPVYGNTIVFKFSTEENKVKGDVPFFRKQLNEKVNPGTTNVRVERRRLDNIFDVLPASSRFIRAEVPFRVFENSRVLEDTLKKKWLVNVFPPEDLNYTVVYSHPTDSLLKPMMHRSDNFFAEQSLLMVSKEVLGIMNESKLIDTILKTDFKDLPQKPRWADGSGLSRYNLFTPQDFVMILNKIRNEFGMDRVKEVFATGNEGTLSNYYKNLEGKFYAKTGTLSGVVALSGYLYTRKNKLLLVSVLVNNHQTSATTVRRAVEQFINTIYEKY